MMKINRIPSIITFSDKREGHNNRHLTYAKLKVLHTGKTEDGRQFTVNFAEKLIQELPHTPIIGNYIEEKEDFGGHDFERQIYGFIPEVGEHTFEEIEGELWIVVDVALFTGVTGGVGEIAAKIIGKSHSLELDPETVEMHFDDSTLVFTDGSIIGLCVLGDDKEPAFKGSEFFSYEDNQKTLERLIAEYALINQDEYGKIEELVADLNTRNISTISFEQLSTTNLSDEPETSKEIEESVGKQTIDGGVEDMDMKTLNDFMKETYDEKFEKIISTYIEQHGNDFYIAQFGPESFIVYDFMKYSYLRIGYSITEEGEVVLLEAVKVLERYLTEEEIQAVFEKQSEEIMAGFLEDLGVESIDIITEAFEQVEKLTADIAEFQERVAGLEEQIVGFKAIQEQNEALESELNNAKDQIAAVEYAAKLDMLGDFSEVLDEEEMETLTQQAQDLDIKALEKEAIFLAYQKQQNAGKIKFGRIPGLRAAQEDEIKTLVEQYK